VNDDQQMRLTPTACLAFANTSGVGRKRGVPDGLLEREECGIDIADWASTSLNAPTLLFHRHEWHRPAVQASPRRTTQQWGEP
jgi:hypothetical protein